MKYQDILLGSFNAKIHVNEHEYPNLFNEQHYEKIHINLHGS